MGREEEEGRQAGGGIARERRERGVTAGRWAGTHAQRTNSWHSYLLRHGIACNKCPSTDMLRKIPEQFAALLTQLDHVPVPAAPFLCQVCAPESDGKATAAADKVAAGAVLVEVLGNSESRGKATVEAADAEQDKGGARKLTEALDKAEDTAQAKAEANAYALQVHPTIRKSANY